MPRIEGLKQLQATLKRLEKKFGKPKPSVLVGYTANYAVFVHENLQPAENARGKARVPGRQGKYLEQPAREKQDELARIIATATKNGATLEQALFMAGLRLQRESQKLVPVDTGNLRGSAFTEKE